MDKPSTSSAGRTKKELNDDERIGQENTDNRKKIHPKPKEESTLPCKFAKVVPTVNEAQQQAELDVIASNSKTGCKLEPLVFRRKTYMRPNEEPTQHSLTKSLQFVDRTMEGVRAAPAYPNFRLWNFLFDGPAGSCYEGARFFGRVSFASEQIDRFAPHVKFDSLFFHPDCNTDGVLDTRELDAVWGPDKCIVDVFLFIRQKMENPKVDEHVDPRQCFHPEVAALCKTDPRKFKLLALEATMQLI